MEKVSSQTDFSVGDRFKYVGEYEILDEIARGGMGVVFRARQSKLGRKVALKMILAGRLASRADVDRFTREARAAANLKHPNIVGVHEVGEHDGHHYFTMDLVDGRSLASIISEETLPPRRAAELIQMIAMAIDYAHQQGVLHRDLKPANILIDDNGQPHVSDFGLAKAIFDEDTKLELTATGQILGTPSYMSPEQASARHDDVAAASDVYSLGAILYACLVGRGPFVADSAVDTIRQVIDKEPVAPRLLSAAIPKDLETICLKCLQKEPNRRYTSAANLAEDLKRFIEGRPVLARPVPVTTKLWSWSKRNPVIAGLMTLSLLLLVTGAIVSTYFAIRADERARAEIAQRERADESASAANQAKREMATALDREAVALREAESARDQANRAKKLEADARARAEKSLANELAARKLIAAREREARWSEYVAKLTVLRRPWEDHEFGQLSRMVNDLKSADGQVDTSRNCRCFVHQRKRVRRPTWCVRSA